ncbi:MAG TPA: PQQ-dependent sugar dehydrogenase [Gammaproteobacteria bacterium]
MVDGVSAGRCRRSKAKGTGEEFPDWHGNAFIGGLSSQALVRVEIEGESAREAERFDVGRGIRAVEQGRDGAIWILEHGERGSGGRPLQLTARN